MNVTKKMEYDNETHHKPEPVLEKRGWVIKKKAVRKDPAHIKTYYLRTYYFNERSDAWVLHWSKATLYGSRAHAELTISNN